MIGFAMEISSIRLFNRHEYPNVQGRNLYCTWTADPLFVNYAFPTVSESSKTHNLTLANHLLFRSSTSYSCVHLASSPLLLRQLLSPTFDKINEAGAP